MIDTEKQILVHSTTDYDKFYMIEGNRTIRKGNLRKLLESMAQEQLIIPIIVNEKGEIIDGQHRYIACKTLKKPVYYIVNTGYGIDQVKRANTVGENWTKDDFLNTYVSEGDPDYVRILRLKNEKSLQISIILKIIASFQNVSVNLVVNRFENGQLKIGEVWADILYFCDQLEMFADYKLYKTNSFVTAFLKLYHHEEYDPKIMEKQAKWVRNFQPKGNTSEVLLDELCRTVYSYRLGKGKIYYDTQMRRFFK